DEIPAEGKGVRDDDEVGPSLQRRDHEQQRRQGDAGSRGQQRLPPLQPSVFEEQATHQDRPSTKRACRDTIFRAESVTTNVIAKSRSPLATRADRPRDPASPNFVAMLAAMVLPPVSVTWTLMV